ncbi:MAG: thiolase family protein [Myxococcota bacterium]|jgi:acetyl-CoA acetyltransferase
MAKRSAAIAGLAEWKPERVWPRPMFSLEACAELAALALADAGIEKGEVDGLCIGGIYESPLFGPSAAAEYLGIRANFAETVDLGGATSAGMLWRAAAAIEVGACETVLVLCPSVMPPRPDGAARGKMDFPIYLGGDAWGSPQGAFEIPAGLVAATPSFAMVAQRYMARYGLREETLAKIAVDARYNAQFNPDAIFYGKPITVDDVMRSRRVADPLKLLEIVMPCFGGGALLVTTPERAARARHRPVYVAGFGEHLTHKSITYAPDLLDNPIRVAAERAFRMAGVAQRDVHVVQPYDCFTITVLVTLENAGFCGKGEGERFVSERSLRWDGDFPLNTHGGQLGAGQAGTAGGLSHLTEAVRQLQGRATGRQLKKCDVAYANGTGGMMAEQVALILQGA